MGSLSASCSENEYEVLKIKPEKCDLFQPIPKLESEKIGIQENQLPIGTTH